jgi:hypothetical protein
MRGLFAKTTPPISCGSLRGAPGRLGYLVRNNRTHARMMGINNLLNTHPWASWMEHEIFLKGFDQGEAFAVGRSDKLDGRLD